MQTYLTRVKLSLAAVLSAVAFVTAGCTTQPSISGFRPVYPPLTATIIPLYNPFNPSSMEDILDWPTVDSLQPTLRWKPFPGEHQIPFGQDKPFVEVDPASVRDVRYDLRIWTVLDKAPGELAYEIEGLTEPFHKLERPLKPKAEYYWSVRARFSLDEQPKVTEWSLTQFPCPGGYWFDNRCTRDVARRIGYIPPLHYYRFKTPRQ